MERLLHKLLQSSASRYPDGIAVIDGDRSVTYGELERRSNHLSHVLLRLGVARHDRIGLYLDKSLESVLGIYAVLKSGAAYVPLDPQAPMSRLAYIARDCDMRVLLTGKEKVSSWRALLEAAPNLRTLIVLNGSDTDVSDPPPRIRVLTLEALDGAPDNTPQVSTIDLDLSYILYTSGSTGDPKGVMLSHLNALTFVDWAVETFDVGPEDRLSNHAPLHFDLSIFDLFAAAKAAAAVILVPPQTSVFPIQISRFIEQQRITIWYSVPSVLSMLVQRGKLRVGDFPRLRKILFAGEVFPTKHLRALMRLLPHVSFFDLYGPTETNVCTYYEVPDLPDGHDEPIPIGRAISNVEVFAVSDDGSLTPPGEVGELFVRGSSVMLGYWGDTRRTTGSLVPYPVEGGACDRVYKTGDLVRQGEDGNYRFLGRRDSQIKSRGYRIELGEIETALFSHPSVVDCAAIAIPDELITNRIEAYVVVRDSTTQGDLVRFCADRIPRYMIPEAFEFREMLPKTSTGKIDRRSLSAEPRRSREGGEDDHTGTSSPIHRSRGRPRGGQGSAHR
jgi:L-proline---[L-prolyl-carrier protein] ligase